MQITSVTKNPVAAAPPKPTPANATSATASPKRTPANVPVAVAPPKLTPANVPAAALKAAAGDGDGRTGTAALNDGDAAAHAARRQAVDVKA